ncbi:hypothetical protein L6164_033138 [Bauhinia variegata]|uniref:Uncharacterized protein n=1 Tax=Bauhinia variegata TaxID=167791 RepID=A0ACB9KQR6_BAUVA|nr:hypothetical protein L6164_033138 [Bauhinia variegata]
MEEMYEIIIEEAGHEVQPSCKSEIEDADMESVIMLGLLELIFKETLTNAEDKIRSLNAKYVNENHILVNLAMESIKNKEALRLEAAEKEKLNQEVLMLMSKLEEKDKAAQEVAVTNEEALRLEAAEKEKLKQEMLMLMSKLEEKDKVAQEVAEALAEALKEVEQYKEKMYELHQNLEQRTKELREIDEERKVLYALTQEKQDALTQIEAREMDTRKQMGSTIVLARELLTAVSGFESRVNKDISRNCSRVESMSSVFHCLIKKANILKTNGLLYKQRLETNYSNLEKAEVEVDLLADEVDTLLNFLEEIYKKLDHYSPILQHYPGITEILELVRRKLIGESRIPV